MTYGIATLNKYTEKSRRKGGEKIIFGVNWLIASGVAEKPIEFQTKQQAIDFGEGQVWQYKILEFNENLELTKPLENFTTYKPSDE